MGRPVKFTADAILDATLQLVAANGAGSATVSGIAEALGAPSGSIYHRFASRDILVARLWMRTVAQFQEGFLAALELPRQEDAARAAMLHTPRWSSRNLAAAALLLRHSHTDLMRAWPEELGAELRSLNAGVHGALIGFARRRFSSDTPALLAGIRFALIDIPYSAARTHIRSGRSLTALEEALMVSAGEAVLARLDAGEA